MKAKTRDQALDEFYSEREETNCRRERNLRILVVALCLFNIYLLIKH